MRYVRRGFGLQYTRGGDLNVIAVRQCLRQIRTELWIGKGLPPTEVTKRLIAGRGIRIRCGSPISLRRIDRRALIVRSHRTAREGGEEYPQECGNPKQEIRNPKEIRNSN